jgi:hypothetical protein
MVRRLGGLIPVHVASGRSAGPSVVSPGESSPLLARIDRRRFAASPPPSVDA